MVVANGQIIRDRAAIGQAGAAVLVLDAARVVGRHRYRQVLDKYVAGLIEHDLERAGGTEIAVALRVLVFDNEAAIGNVVVIPDDAPAGGGDHTEVEIGVEDVDAIVGIGRIRDRHRAR